ncbi:MAG TPA: Y-family DNA polymerase [Legionellaceae bacterium]|nr:Y-family DNA polymerase [Legionellaceae bacterium]
MFALIDCNNFFVSCERVFRPDLTQKPVVVLSNNDGCVISRSNEAKMLNIKMGEPYHTIRQQCTRYKISVFSSNYALYSDFSCRVMSIIEEAWPDMKQYSIDEAFLDLSTMPTAQQESFCHHLHQKILQWTGIPTSIGIGPTQTLAKMANHICKKILKTPVMTLTPQSPWLKQIDIKEIWGIGRQWEKKLKRFHIHTASDLLSFSPQMIKQYFNVGLMRTAMEVQGQRCGGLAEERIPKSILSSRSFGKPQTEWSILANAISRHITIAYEKLRAHGLLVKTLSVFVLTNRFRKDLPQYHNMTQCDLSHPTDDIRILISQAKMSLKKIYKQGFIYKKVGICFDVLIEKHHQQIELFPASDAFQNKEAFLNILDTINHKFGRQTLKLAAEGINTTWKMRQQQLSPCYTTQWSDLCLVK